MTAIVIVALALAAAVITVDYITPAIRGWLLRRAVVRRSVADQQLQAMLAAQQLSLLAWKARHEMYDLAAERTSRRDRLARHGDM